MLLLLLLLLQTLLHYAGQYGRVGCVRLLLWSGADMYVKDVSVYGIVCVCDVVGELLTQ